MSRQRPEEGRGSPGLELQKLVSHDAGTENQI